MHYAFAIFVFLIIFMMNGHFDEAMSFWLLQEALCALLDGGGQVLLELTTCREASQKSPRSFWAFRRLGYLQV